MIGTLMHADWLRCDYTRLAGSRGPGRAMVGFAVGLAKVSSGGNACRGSTPVCQAAYVR
jgi:hypothetical protein